MGRVISRLLVAILAVGASAVAVASSAGPAGADIDWGTPNEVAGSLNLGGDAVINSVSCSSVGNCAAGGYYKDSSKNTQSFVVDEVAGTWGTPSEVAGSLNAGGNAWINSVSCSSVGNCAAGGRYRDSSGNYQNFVVDEVAGAWGTASEVAGTLNVGGHAWVNSVSCTSDGNCAAGGRYKDGFGNYQVFVVNEVDGIWESVSEVAGLLNVDGDADLNSVSCSSDGNCVAGGRYKDSSGDYQAFVVDEVAGVWEPASEVAGILNIGGGAQVFSVSCSSDGNCVAGGRYKDGSGNYQNFVADEVAGVWEPASEVAGTLSVGGGAWLVEVSCSSDGNCATIGRYKDSSGNIQAFVINEVAGTWGTASEVAGLLNLGGDAGDNTVAWVNTASCSSDGNCATGGYYKDSSGNIQAFVVDEVAGVWEPASEVVGTLNVGGDGEVSSISCTSDGSCALGGYYKDGAGNIQAFVADGVYAITYTVTFDANGGTGTMAAETESSPTALTANAFTFTGYTFTGWNTAANDSGTAYADGATYPFTASVTLYAQWTAVPVSYAVTFNANGGSGTMAAETESSPTALTANAFTFTGYTFTGWNTAANDSGTAYADGATYPFTASVTLYAQWTAVPVSYTVTFNANGGTGTMAPETDNAPTALTANAFTRSGYTFNDWNTVAGGRGTSYANGAIYPFTASVTLYAQWMATVGGPPLKATTRNALKLSARKVTYEHEQTEHLSVTVSPQFPGSKPTGKVTVKQSTRTLCVIKLSSGKGSCKLSAKQLKAGTYHLVATYGGSTNFAGSTSPKEKLTVVR